MGDRPEFYRRDDDWRAIIERLKQTSCPHCQIVGTLIRHGVLTGFDDASPPRIAIRARRIYCSNRHRRRGCGRTFSVRLAHTLQRLSLSTRSLWGFLRRAVAGTLAAAARDTNCPRSERTFQRLWRRFDRAQSAIRTALHSRGPPPAVPAEPARRPAPAHLLAHLRATFPHDDCPIAAFQLAMRAAFI